MRIRDHSKTLKKLHLSLTSTHRSAPSVKKWIHLLLRPKLKSVPQIKINTWINAAVNSKVEHVEIYDKTFDKFSFEVPSCIFNCHTITVLKLSGVPVKIPYVDLPSLKVLHLNRVRFPNIKSIQALLYGCPLLQDLALKIWGIKYKRLSINKERLKNLISADVSFYLFTLESLSNVKALRIDTIGFSPLPDAIVFYNLIHLEISYYAYSSDGTILQCLRNCPKLETLIIDKFDWRVWRQPGVPQCVSSHLKEFHLGNFKGREIEFKLARFIMGNARVLETISIRRENTSKATSEQEIMLQRLSSCPKSSENCRLLFK
ncbi:F-box/FBD/LRR-repeat protein At1g78750-like [Neltuma alba]|uniref:F-box/FBD/LRR-repeat protein At1g78750-like n=1 Tax=Neltuma alba TaxID=207710 RepID=UPI0010A37A9C|nr:F-box/FBD/LRR-repeat protein At1g78750-like [Prosopis alba]